MSLRTRLFVFLMLNVGVLLGVSYLGSRLSEAVAERIRLGVENRSIRRLHRLALEESRIATEILFLPRQTDLSHYHALIESIQEELDDLKALPASPETLRELPQWQSKNREFLHLLERLAFRKPLRSLEQAREALLKLRKQGSEQLAILKAAGDRLRSLLKSEDVQIQSQMARLQTRVVALCFVPVLVIAGMAVSFGGSLSRQLTALEGAFKRLGDGDLGIRLAGQAPTLPETRSVFRSFDALAERLQHLDRLKSQFYSMAAHDLRSPLGTILLAVQSLRDHANLGAAALRPVDIIERKVRTMLGLTESLLDRFFLERGQVEAIRQPANLGQLLRECAEDLGPRAEARGQTLVVEPPEEALGLWCDPTMLTQILDNLVGNAIKYSNEGDTIRLGARPSEDGDMLFHVSDHGPGIPVQERSLIFAPSCRGASVRYRIVGSGLGLAICKEFVAAHGGRIWVEDNGGKGCRFCFTLPRPAGSSPEARGLRLEA
jgi:signal transduction histidine kinase